jgi:hypothetical protein
MLAHGITRTLHFIYFYLYVSHLFAIVAPILLKGLYRYVEKDPGTFKTGDIVEMGFALVVWKKQGKNVGPDWSCMLMLRTLTFLDGRFTKVTAPSYQWTHMLMGFIGSSFRKRGIQGPAD